MTGTKGKKAKLPRYRERIDIRLGKGKRDRYLARWWDDIREDGGQPSHMAKMILYEALTKISALTGKPIAVELIEERDMSADDEREAFDSISHFGT